MKRLGRVRLWSHCLRNADTWERASSSSSNQSQTTNIRNNKNHIFHNNLINMYLFFSWKLLLWEKAKKKLTNRTKTREIKFIKDSQTSFEEEKLSFLARDAIEMEEKPVMWKSLVQRDCLFEDHFPVGKNANRWYLISWRSRWWNLWFFFSTKANYANFQVLSFVKSFFFLTC